MGGYCGKLARIDLTTHQVSVEALDLTLAKKFIGGRGLGTYILNKEVSAEVDPFSADNKLIIVTGPLTGTAAPASGRHMVVTKSPLSGTVACSNSGGFWGAELKKAGWDMLILEGKSAQPCQIVIRD